MLIIINYLGFKIKIDLNKSDVSLMKDFVIIDFELIINNLNVMIGFMLVLKVLKVNLMFIEEHTMMHSNLL